MLGVITVDGTNLIHRSYAVASKRQGIADADALAPVVAGTSVLLSRMTLLPESWTDARHEIAFDLGGDSGRGAKYGGYKSHRTEHSGVIAEATTALAEVCVRLGYRVYLDADHEADDLIATLHAAARRDGNGSILVGTDRDLWQLIDDHTTVRSPKSLGDDIAPGDAIRYREIGMLTFYDEYGFAPRLLPDYKALAGDASDGYPGVRGIGKVWAQRLVAEYGSLDKVFAALYSGHIQTPRVFEALTADDARESAYLYRELATLIRDVPLPTPYGNSGRRLAARPQMGPR